MGCALLIFRHLIWMLHLASYVIWKMCFVQCFVPMSRRMESPEFMEVSDDVPFHVVEYRATAWNMPRYYDELRLMGAGRFGQVWYGW